MTDITTVDFNIEELYPEPGKRITERTRSGKGGSPSGARHHTEACDRALRRESVRSCLRARSRKESGSVRR